MELLDTKQIAELLHSAGLNAYSIPNNQSAQEWNEYRERLADNIAHWCEVRRRHGQSE